MLMGHAEGLPEREHLLSDSSAHFPELEEEDDFFPKEILYEASFEALSSNNLTYDTIIWVSISLLLVLAWGFGILMLLCLPIRRYIFHHDILSRKLFVNRDEIVLKVSRPSITPFFGVASIEKRVPLNMVIEVVIEQGFLQAIYGICTFKVQSIARGKAASVDELHIQGVDEPEELRAVIIREASKSCREVGKSWASLSVDNLPRIGSSRESPSFKSPLKSRKVSMDIMLSKIEEVMSSVKKLEKLVQKTISGSVAEM